MTQYDPLRGLYDQTKASSPSNLSCATLPLIPFVPGIHWTPSVPMSSFRILPGTLLFSPLYFPLVMPFSVLEKLP